MVRTQMYAEVGLYYLTVQLRTSQSVCAHIHIPVCGEPGARCGASAPLVLSSDWLTTGGRRTGESFTNGGRSGTSCLDNILWRVRGGRKEEGGGRRERKKERRESKEVGKSGIICAYRNVVNYRAS